MTRPRPSPTPEGELATQVREAFRRRYGEEPRLFRAPGRVNLIGEHTDYNDGFVLPLAIDRATFVAARARNDRHVELQSLNLEARAHFELDMPSVATPGHWSSYVEGVARTLEAKGLRLKGANLVLASDVPAGAGLSSSAALEMAAGLALLSVSGHEEIDHVELALAGQKAEHDYVGTKCGIMDQYVSALAKPEHALLIDCRSLEAKPVPLSLPQHVIVVLDTGVKHELASSEYNTRRAECEEGVALLKEALPGIRALRDVSVEQFEKHAGRLPDVVRRRCRHVVHENARTLAAVDALKRNDLGTVGRLMAESHASLRDDYEVSCKELDLLVALASAQPGVVGARMTGGGFGGSSVNLVERAKLDAVLAKVREGYAAQTGREPGVLITGAGAGALELR